VALLESMLVVELAKFEDDWLWCNGRIGNRSELGFDCFGMFVERAKGRMESIGGGGEPIAWCG
jgi:hypothetical protein